MVTPTQQCRDCGRKKPLSEIISVRRRAGGNYRRPSRTYHSSMCRECASNAMDYIKTAQAEGRTLGPTTSLGFFRSDIQAAFEVET